MGQCPKVEGDAALQDYDGGWSRSAVHVLATYADSAYGEGRGTLIEDSGTDTQCFLHDGGTYAVLSFRGTEVPTILSLASTKGSVWLRAWSQCRDLMTDANITQDSWVGGGRVHSGFRRSFASVEKRIYQALEGLSPEARSNLFVTGHSLGGALATLAASRFGCRMVATFGSPRVGNREFARSFGLQNAGKYFRVFNRSDVVARVPAPIRFRHVGLPIFLTHQGTIHPRPGLMTRLVSLARNLLRCRHASLLGDHGIDQYISALEES